MSHPLISFQNIEKSFNNVKILSNLNFDIYEKDLIGLVGKSGEGKTTLLRVLIGFYYVDNGKIIYNSFDMSEIAKSANHSTSTKSKPAISEHAQEHAKHFSAAVLDITKNSKVFRNLIGFCTQENSFYPELTVEENLYYYGRLYSIKREELKKRIPELLSLVSLQGHEKKLAGRISGGMKRRLDFAISLIHNPPVLILDEPTTGLDPIVEKSIWNLIEKINKEGKTIIVSSHHLHYLEKKCKKIAVLSKGNIKVYSIDDIKKKHPKKGLSDVFEELIR